MKVPIRVLMLTTHFYPTVGGAERQAHALARELLKQGQSVTVVTYRPYGQPPFEVVDGIPIHRVITPVSRGISYGLSYLFSLMTFLVRWRHQYDLIHVHLLLLDAFAAGVLKAALKKPALAKAACGGAFGDVARLRRVPFGSLFLPGLRRLDRVVAPSRQIEDELVGYGLSGARIVRIPNGVDSERFCPAEDREAIRRSLGLRGKVVSFAGRLDPQKGLIPLLQAWEQVAAELSDATLLLLGKGPQEAELKRLSERMGLSNRVVFCGEQRDILPYLQASDLFVLPSVAEGMSNALLEAMATGLPCIATRVGGNVDLIMEGENGILVRPGDYCQLAEVLIKLLQDPESARRLGIRARCTVEEGYTMTKIGRRYLELYRELLDES